MDSGTALLRLEGPATLQRSTLVVRDAAGEHIGGIIQQPPLHGLLRALCERRWAGRDAPGGGLTKAVFAIADSYVLRVPHPLPDPLRSLTLGAALCIDTVVEQGLT